MKVVIVGGSLVGLMHGIMFKHHGHDVHILEKNPRSLEAQAAGVGVREHVKLFMDVHDRLKTPLTIPCKGARVLNHQGHVARSLLFPIAQTSWDALYFRLRANFDGESTPYNPDPAPSQPSDGEAIYNVGQKLTDIVVSTEKGTLVHYQSISDGTAHTLEADLVICADGPNSTARSILHPSAPERPYAGYALWRGTVPEQELSARTLEQFSGWISMCPPRHARELPVIYHIPGRNGSLKPGERDINFAWYTNVTPADLSEILIDTDGHKHHWSIPIGKLRPEVWQKQLEQANKSLNAPCREVVSKIKEPFLQVISDYRMPRAVFHDGKVLLVGDAFALMRPHTGQGINQGAQHALLLEKVLFGDGEEAKAGLDGWERHIVDWAQVEGLQSISMGTYFLGGWIGWLPNAILLYRVLLWRKVRGWFSWLMGR